MRSVRTSLEELKRFGKLPPLPSQKLGSKSHQQDADMDAALEVVVKEPPPSSSEALLQVPHRRQQSRRVRHAHGIDQRGGASRSPSPTPGSPQKRSKVPQHEAVDHQVALARQLRGPPSLSRVVSVPAAASRRPSRLPLLPRSRTM